MIAFLKAAPGCGFGEAREAETQKADKNHPFRMSVARQDEARS